MTLLYHFMLYCIALCNTGVLMPYQCLYDFSCMILLYHCMILLYHCITVCTSSVCVLVVGSRVGGDLDAELPLS